MFARSRMQNSASVARVQRFEVFSKSADHSKPKHFKKSVGKAQVLRPGLHASALARRPVWPKLNVPGEFAIQGRGMKSPAGKGAFAGDENYQNGKQNTHPRTVNVAIV